MDPNNSSQKYSEYPPVLSAELEMLDVVGQSAGNYCGYLNELMRSVLADDKSSAEAALGILFGNPPLGVSPGWPKEFEEVEHLINHVAKPVKLELPRHEDWLQICQYERPAWKTDVVEARLSVFERHLARESFNSAHHAATVLLWSLVNALRIAGLGERDGDLGGNLPHEQWERLKLCLSVLAENDFAALRITIEEESVAAKNYARETVVGQASLKPDDEVQQQTSKKIKPTGPTVEIIRMIQKGMSCDEISVAKKCSVEKVRGIRSRLMRGKYSLI